jgi:GT2 family glycosyltransferase
MSTEKDHQDAAVIIPHYDDVARLTRCLTALLQGWQRGVEVVVVDNGSHQPLDAVRAAFPTVRFLTEPTPGAAAARNRGVAETCAPLLWFLDADCVPAPDWLAVARRVATRADIVGGSVEVFDETPGPRSGAEAFEAVFAFRVRRYVKEEGFAVTANLLTTRRVFEAVGPFVPGLSEDKDWGLRARAAGFGLVYEDSLRVAHPSRRDWAALRSKWQRLTRESFALHGAGIAARLRWAVRALALPPSALADLPKVLTSPRLRGTGERAAGAAVLLRLRGLRCLWMLRQAAGGQV